MKTDFKTYYAVIFTSTHTENVKGYNEIAQKMEILAKQQDGYLGMDIARNNTSAALSGAVGITVSYWQSLEAIKNWKQHSHHLQAQLKGKQDWYSWYNVKICKVESEYEFTKQDT
jgi:heme-degrading monooxygenase HmoA